MPCITRLELFLCCYKYFIKTNQQPIKDILALKKSSSRVIHGMYMGFLNYNKIFDIDILNLETGCNKIRDDFYHVV
jgi:hypothetical protein